MKDTGKNPIGITIVGVICLLFFAAFIVYAFMNVPGLEELLAPVFNTINPFTSGVYFMGCGLLLTLMYARGNAGATLGLVVAVCYLIMAAVSLVALINLHSLTMYGPNVVIVIAGIVIMVQKGKRKRER
ncbi:MAG: hypothetical protein IJ128_06400 [Firmicutes bacterium]|nr:hypothetical protein [Bacillota bacterium]